MDAEQRGPAALNAQRQHGVEGIAESGWPLQALSQLARSGRGQEVGDAQRDAEGFPDSVDQLQTQQRMPAQREEILIGVDLPAFQRCREQPAHDFFFRGARRRLLAVVLQRRRGQFAGGQLAVGRERKGRHHHDDAGNHVMGQLTA